MSEQIISPGHFLQENDKSLVTKSNPVVGAALVGPTVKGTPMVPTLVTSYSEYLSQFGDIFQSGSTYYEYFTSLTAKEWFNGGGKSLLTRIISGSSGYSTFASSIVPTVSSTLASASVSMSVSINATGSFDIVTGGQTYTLQLTTTSSLVDTSNIFYITLASSTASTAVNIANKINSKSSYLRVTATTGSSLASLMSFTSTIPGTPGTTVSGSALSGGSYNQAFIIENLSWGNVMNNTSSIIAGSSNVLQSGSVDNVKWEISSVDIVTGNFTLLVRRGDDSDISKNVLETWSNLSLDEQQPNFISRVIGDQKLVYNPTSGILELTGNYTNNSQYIRIQPGSVNKIANSILATGVFNTVNSGNLPALGAGINYGSFSGGLIATNRTGTFFENITSIATDCQGFIYSDYTNAINSLLTNKDEFDFKMIFAPGITLGTGPLSSISDDFIGLSENRGDNIAIVDTTTYGQTVSQAVTAAAALTSNYAGTYYPWVQVYSSNLGKAVWVPPSVVLAGVYAFNDEVSAPWFAPAGLGRGVLGSVIRAERKLSQSDRDSLYNANVNPIATFPQNGTVVFGQKTLQKRSTSLDRINVRRLLIDLKRFLGNTARSLVFEQNTQSLRNKFLAVADPYLESVTQRQGLYGYKVVMDSSNNTSDIIDRNQLVGQIYVQPTKTAEFIILNFTLTPTGSTFS